MNLAKTIKLDAVTVMEEEEVREGLWGGGLLGEFGGSDEWFYLPTHEGRGQVLLPKC